MKILYVTTVSGSINAFLIPHIKMLLKSGHQVDIACKTSKPINDPELLIGKNCNIYEIPFHRSPLNKDNFLAYKNLEKLIQKEEYDLIHTHTPIASVITRLVCKKFKNLNVIYTAHGFHFYKGASWKNWLIYYPLERWLAKYTNLLITLNKEDFKKANTSFNANKTVYLPGVGVDIKRISENPVEKDSKKTEINVPCDSKILLSIGELNKNKNHEIIIKSMALLNDPNLYYVICGQGPLEKYLKNLALELGIEKQIKLLGFRTDINEICKISDVFIFPSFREGLPVSIMEAMACNLPVICSNIRGNSDLIVNEKGGFLIEENNQYDYKKHIEFLVSNESERKKMGEFNKEKVKEFSIENVLRKLNKIYLDFN